MLNRVHAALLAVGAVEPRHFCRAMGERAVQMGGSSAVRIAAVAAMISLVKARGTSLDADLPVVVNAVLRPLDPSVPQLREGCLAASTAALRELVKRYPMMSFHQGLQRLAVGTVEGVVVIYDLRTATVAHAQVTRSAFLLCLFSSSGEYVALFAAEEQTLALVARGRARLFGFLGLQGSCLPCDGGRAISNQFVRWRRDHRHRVDVATCCDVDVQSTAGWVFHEAHAIELRVPLRARTAFDRARMASD